MKVCEPPENGEELRLSPAAFSSSSYHAGQFTVRVTVPTVAVAKLDEPLDVPVPVTVTVYVPAVVPGCDVPLPPLPALRPPPQPVAPTMARRTNAPNRASQLRRRLGVTKNMTKARAVPPADGHRSRCSRFSALVAAVVLTVNVED
jgi:hypothetical protein